MQISAAKLRCDVWCDGPFAPAMAVIGSSGHGCSAQCISDLELYSSSLADADR